MKLLTTSIALLVTLQLIAAAQSDQLQQPRIAKRTISEREAGRLRDGMKQRRAYLEAVGEHAAFTVGELVEKFEGMASAAEKGKGLAIEGVPHVKAPKLSISKTFVLEPERIEIVHAHEPMRGEGPVGEHPGKANPWISVHRQQNILEQHNADLRLQRNAIVDAYHGIEKNGEEVDGLKQSNEELRAKIEQIKSKQPGYWKDKGRTLLTWGALGTAGTVAITSGLNEKEQAQLATSQGEDIESLRNEVVKLKGAQGVRGPGTLQQGVPAIGSWRQSAPEGVGAVNQAVASSRDDNGSSGV